MGLQVTTFEEQVAQILEKAADALDENGWIKGFFGGEKTGFCAIGALRYASNVPLNHPSPNAFYREYAEARKELRDQVGTAVVNWNDHHARSKDDVTSQMRQAARRVRAGVAA